VTRLDVFRTKDWAVLQNKELLALTQGQQRKMKGYDYYWREKLENILESDTVVSHVLATNFTNFRFLYVYCADPNGRAV
jgi:hypothetical protein